MRSTAPSRPVSDYSILLKSVQEAGLLRRRSGHYIGRMVLLVLALAGCWVSFSLLGSHWAQIGVAAALGVVFTQILFLSHDAAHRQIFSSHRANERTALIFGTGGGGVSLAWWMNKHTRHHQAPNQMDKDPDIDPSLVFFYPRSKALGSGVLRYLHERQGWWFYPLLVVEALNLQVQSMISLLTEPKVKRRWLELALLTLRLAVIPALAFVYLPFGLAAVFVAVQWAVCGVYLGSVFAVSHVGMPIVPKEARIDFFRRQVLTSRNIAGGRLASGLMGGLNYQIEHHLFPSMPRSNLRRARAVVRQHCAERDITYHEVTIHRAWGIVIRYLNDVGIGGRHMVACPTAAVLR
jgi:fatty acid desaturase